MKENAANYQESKNSQSYRGAGAAPQPPSGSPSSADRTPQHRAADLLPHIAMPKGGGAIRSIGEKFAVNPATGSGQLTVPIPVSRGRSGFAPDHHLAYDSGSGNGVFGFGWTVSAPAIWRKMDKGLPQYRDAVESDTFVMAGVEDLVAIRNASGIIQRSFRALHGKTYEITGYLPRVERDFAQIERWVDQATGIGHWRLIDGDNVTSLYGWEADSRSAHPEDPTQIFSYRICRCWDSKGNVISYRYKREDGVGVDTSQLSEAHRSHAARGAQVYLKSIRFGNLTPWYADWSASAGGGDLPADWAFELVLDYGDHQDAIPTPAPDQPWPARADAFSTYRAGFELRTYRLCRRFLMFHRLAELGVDACLVKSLDLTYEPGAAATFLKSATSRGYLRNATDGSYVGALDAGGAPTSPLSLPPIEFEYSRAQIDATVQLVRRQELPGVPVGVDGQGYQWVDLDGEGLPGILSERVNGWYYSRNVSAWAAGESVDSNRAAQPCFEGMTLVAPRPSTAALSQGQRLLDLAGEGEHCLVEYRRPDAGYYDRTLDGSWNRFAAFASLPNIDWSDPNLRHVDLDGDGLPDVLISEDEVFTWYSCLGKEGFGPPQAVRKPFDEARGPAIAFADGTESIYLADMSGDGLTDIVRIRNGEVCYWPNLGYCRFGAKVCMDPAPLFDTFDQFDQQRIRLADIDGSGTTDIVYLGRGQVTFWLNQAGNSWSAPQTLTQFPNVDNLATVAVVDLLGSGTSCIVWSSALPDDADAPLRYINLMAGGKPHLLTVVTNNLGARTQARYVSSTHFYLQDRALGKPWITRLGFPVQVVERVEIFDQVSHSKFASRYAYHHGYFDGAEREFRGFGMVEQWDGDSFASVSGAGLFTQVPDTSAEEFHLPPVHTKSWFHNGAFIGGDRISLQYAQEFYGGDPQAWSLSDSLLPEGMNAHEAREACRALRGHLLRQEVYSDDGSELSGCPYNVSEHTYQVRQLQGLNGNRHAVFHAFETQVLSYHYERNPADPRIEHQIAFEVDPFGYVLKSATIGYPRRAAGAGGAVGTEGTVRAGGVASATGMAEAAASEPEQTRTWIIYTERDIANYPDAVDWRRLGLEFGARSYELTGLVSHGAEAVAFSPASIAEATSTAAAISYEAHPETSKVQKRLIRLSRALYRKDDLSGPLPLGQMESLALPYESYSLALTGGLVSSVFAGKVSVDEMSRLLESEGGYRDLDSDGSWWVPSGRLHFSPDPDSPDAAFARAHFYLPQGARDAMGHVSRVSYDSYDLVPIRTVDALGNVSSAHIDYRVLMPILATDQNGNRAAVAFDAFGMVIATAVMGKEGENEGDTLNDPTTRFEYDMHQWHRLGKPNFAHVRIREQHGAANLRWQEAYSYSDGLGREVMKKSQAPPGPAPLRGADGSLLRGADGKPVVGQLMSRWIGSGRGVHDNKGNTVKRYEPYFSSTLRFEDERDLVEQGVTPILRYDPLSRLVRTDLPDGTFSRVEHGPWKEVHYDANDTIRESRWYADRMCHAAPGTSAGSGVAAEMRAAKLAAVHADTPSVWYLDPLGRTFLTVADNGAGGKYPSRVELDISGRQKSITDARGNRAMTQVHNLLGATIHHVSMDAGENWMLPNVVGNPIRAWDSRGNRTRHVYDALGRVTQLWVQSGSVLERLAERFVYGESLDDGVARNARKQLYQHYDTAGLVTTPRYDFKGNLLESKRQLLVNYKDEVDWGAAVPPSLEPQIYVASSTFDALNRHITATTPDQSVATPVYDEANRLSSVSVVLQGRGAAQTFVAGISYDAKGQRQQVTLGNGVTTSYEHDPLNYRLRQLTSTRAGDQVILQQLSYTYDPTGNVAEIRDDAQQTTYFSNQVVLPVAQYEYDPIYRLTNASGREHVGQSVGGTPDLDDSARARLPHPNDALAMARYVERYEYDTVGNLLRVLHNAAGNGWSRRYDYDPSCNRLNATNALADPDGIFSAVYAYDAEGNMTRMPHLPLMRWDYKNELQASSRQKVGSGTPETTYYVYSASGERVRKVTERQAQQEQAATRKEERIYLEGFELYRAYDGDGSSIALERETLHVVDGRYCLALIETRTHGNDRGPKQLTRYQLSNALESALLELDEQAQIISYEEYYPFGSTSYQAVRSQTETPKRYRFTGKERDEQSGFYYHGARYYAPWLARWTSADPMMIGDDANAYAYAANNPIRYSDPTGQLEWPSWKTVAVVAAVVVVGVAVTVATGGAAAPLVAAAVEAVGITGAAATVTTGVVVGAVAGAAGGVASEVVRTGVAEGRLPTRDELKSAAVSGAIGGAVTGGIGAGAAALRGGATAARAATTASRGARAVRAITGAAKAGATGAASSGAAEAGKELVTEGHIDAGKITKEALHGAVGGIAGHAALGAIKPLRGALGALQSKSAQLGNKAVGVASGGLRAISPRLTPLTNRLARGADLGMASIGVPTRINEQKQDGHIAGTQRQQNRLAVVGKKTSTFIGGRAEVDALTMEAWDKGRDLGPGLRLHEFGHPVGVGPGGGGYQTQMRVSMNRFGEIHGTPYGPVYHGPLPQ